MKKDNTKIIKKESISKKIIIALMLIILVVIFLITILKTNGIDIIGNRVGADNKALTATKTIAEYEVTQNNTETKELGVLVTLENAKGIERVKIDDFEINAKGKTKVSFDRILLEDSITNIIVKPINEEEETLLLVPSSGYLAGMRVTDIKKQETDWQKKVELSKEESEKPIYYSIDDGENWELLPEEVLVLNNVEIEKLKMNRMQDEIWEVRKKDNIKTNFYDTVTNLIENVVDESGYYRALVQNEQINIHAYVQNEDLEITGTAQYGDSGDVGTASSYAQNMVVLKVNGNLTVNSGAKLTSYGTIYGGPKGLYVYTTGKLENNGEISMTARGAKAVGQNVYLYNNNGTYEYVPKAGANGGAQATNYDVAGRPGNAGGAGSARRTGGGGSGGAKSSYSGVGAQGTSYSGGPGGGGAARGPGQAGGSNGGPGGTGGIVTETRYGENIVGGGAGNPGGKSYVQPLYSFSISEIQRGGDGTGGLLIIYTNEMLNNGTISSNGSNGANGNYPRKLRDHSARRRRFWTEEA